MKKILLYTDTPQVGGAELQTFLLAKFLDKEKFTPILTCSNFSTLDKWCENFEKEDIKVIRLNVRHKHDPRHYKLLKKIIKEEEINVLHAQVWNPASCRFAYSAATSMKIPLITTEHDPFKLSFIKDIFKKRFLKKVSKIITVSKQNAELLKKLYPKQAYKIQVIHNGIDTTWWKSQLLRFTEEDYREIKENEFHAHRNTLIMVCVAELHERKGQKYLIKALKELVEEFPNLKLVLIGDGKDRENLEKLVQQLRLEDHVRFLGKRKDIAPLLKASDIFVLPSKREAFGLVNLEAMMIPLPIVATKVGGIPEVVENGENGILVVPEDEKNMARALKSLIISKKKREKMAENGQKLVLEKFSAKEMAKKYEKIY